MMTKITFWNDCKWCKKQDFLYFTNEERSAG